MAKDDFFNVDWREWDAFFSEDDLKLCSGAGPLVSPAQVVSIERHRRKHKFYERSNRWTPTDVFLWSVGEAPRRDLTQVGGLPYRPADEPWPVDAEGLPMRFFSQIRFRESRDIAPQAKGDVLLLFCSQETQVSDWAYEWRNFEVPLGELATAERCPALLDDLPGWYGHRCRVLDLAEDDPLRLDPDGSEWAATKIGGHPARGVEFEGRHPHGRPILRLRDPATAAGYFATSASLGPVDDCPYPWMNHPAPLAPPYEGPEWQGYSPYDLFAFNLYFRESGAIRWHMDQI